MGLELVGVARGTHDSVADDRNDSILIYVNGKMLPRDDAKISVFDSGYLVGDGVWEGLRMHRGVFVFLEDHLDRLFEGARMIFLDIGKSREELKAALVQTVEANGMKDGAHVRLMVTRGNKKTPSQDPRLTVTPPNIVIIAEYKAANPETKKTGVRLFTSAIRRGSPDYLDPRLNCHSKLHEVIALTQAFHAGADEALMLDIHGFVSTCNATNFFIVRKGEVWTSTGNYCMNGITRAKVIDVCEKNEIVVRQKDFSLLDVYGADEAFVTGTFGGLTPVSEIDHRKLQGDSLPGSMTVRLSDWYDLEIRNVIACNR
ncbi:MAG: aminotransferase class IV [Opitutales bacterium]|jgi:branched-chain amino acid aminotransferase|nr:aminotransferase class IV [Opitutales bacterium]MBT5170484.1 aminotransferase class IV [Opitutales bacterium]MBT6381591.1 aminotransferase class IV [Opitutales bacterium]MBT6768050.1 aminotransferase class IV [Opitutales bacterium]